MKIPQKKIKPKDVPKIWETISLSERKRSERRASVRGRFFEELGKRKKQPIVISPTLLGVVREFGNDRWRFKSYLKMVNKINKIGTQSTFESFDFQPLQLLAIDRKNCRVIERVYPSINMAQLLHTRPPRFTALYGQQIWKRLQAKNAELEEVRSTAYRALSEIIKKIGSRQSFDSAESNILILDYNPKTKKVLVCIIDPLFGKKSPY